MGFSRFWLTMADKEFKVHRRVIRTIFTMIQRAKNDRSERATCIRQCRFITSRISKSMNSRGFTETFPSIYDPSEINRFIFGHWVLIYFIMQSLFGKRNKNLPCFPSKRENLQSAILFILPTAAAIRTQKKRKSYEIFFLSIHFVVKLHRNRLSVCLRDVVSTWHQVT